MCRLPAAERERLKAWIGETLPSSTREIGAWITRECGIDYQGRSGLVALLHRLGIEYRQTTAISRKSDPVKQAAFIEKYEDVLSQLPADEVVMFGDAVRPVGCWAPKEVRVAVEQSSGRDRRKAAPNCTESSSRNWPLKVSWLGKPFASLRDPRRNGSFAFVNVAMSAACWPPDSTGHRAIIRSSWKSRSAAFPDRVSFRPSQQAASSFRASSITRCSRPRPRWARPRHCQGNFRREFPGRWCSGLAESPDLRAPPLACPTQLPIASLLTAACG